MFTNSTQCTISQTSQSGMASAFEPGYVNVGYRNAGIGMPIIFIVSFIQVTTMRWASKSGFFPKTKVHNLQHKMTMKTYLQLFKYNAYSLTTIMLHNKSVYSLKSSRSNGKLSRESTNQQCKHIYIHMYAVHELH